MSESLNLVEDSSSEQDESSRKAKLLPDPKGYKILIALPEPDEMTAGGILKAAETMQLEEVGSICGLVIKLGPDAYSDENRFPSGPFCEEGDFVLMRSYTGTRFKVQ